MRTRPPGVDDRDISRALTGGWGLREVRLRYQPVGFGGYHWLARTGADHYFLTLDDLGAKPWLGTEPDSVFTGLRACYATPLILHAKTGLDCVIPPVATVHGEATCRLTRHYALTVFPFTAGTAGAWGHPIATPDRQTLADKLAALHRRTAAVAALAPLRGSELPERAVLDAALAELGQSWSGGPFSEPARRELAAHAGTVASWLGSFDQLAARLAAQGLDPVITHGEPHPGNVLRSDGRFMLIDWDTVALAPPERDLWMLDDVTHAAFATYTAATGRPVNYDAIRLYRLTWVLNDIASFVGRLRSGHAADGHTRKVCRSLLATLRSGPATDGGLAPGYFAPWGQPASNSS